MSITGKIKTLFSDKENTEALFPRTKISAVSDDDGTGLNVLLDNKIDTVPVTSADNGKFLRVVDGKWAAATVLNAEEASF